MDRYHNRTGRKAGRDGNEMESTKNAISLTREISDEITAYATEKAESLVIRTYTTAGSSVDTRRDSTPDEKRILSALIAGGLRQICYNGGKYASDIAGSLEFAAMPLIKDINTYDSVYRPMLKFCEAHGIRWFS